ncbi:MAG: glycosyl hydrolase family 79 C-terminal domain-containing protein, partial [Solirubrobacteraceae bacterium]
AAIGIVAGCLTVTGCAGGVDGRSTGSSGVGTSAASGGSGGAAVSSGVAAGSGAPTSTSAGTNSGTTHALHRAAPAKSSISISAQAVGNAIPSGFVGFSFEFQAVRAYEGRNPAQIDPVFVQLIRNLNPGQAPVLRIGGDSSDVSYVPARGLRAPAAARYALTPGWLAATAKLAHELGARMILGINLAANDPALSGVEAKAFLHAFGRGSIEAFEIGNEPNVYTHLTYVRTVFGLPVPMRPLDFGYAQYRRQFAAVKAVTLRQASGPALAEPALAVGPVSGPGSWIHSLPSLLSQTPKIAVMTIHRYPLRNCFVPPSSRQYPTITHLLASYATAGLAASVKPWVALADRAHRPLRVDELNSVACFGKAGVSNTFASALWMTDVLFSLARAGVAGVNVHTLPQAAYQVFNLRRAGGRWEGRVAPVYYGMQLFAQAAPPGARLLAVGRRGGSPGLSVWATRATDSTVRVVLINKDPARGQRITLTLPPGSGPTATVERLRAPSVASVGGVTLGGRSYGPETRTGVLGAPNTSSTPVTGGRVTVSVPAGSAALVTVAP